MNDLTLQDDIFIFTSPGHLNFFKYAYFDELPLSLYILKNYQAGQASKVRYMREQDQTTGSSEGCFAYCSIILYSESSTYVNLLDSN